MKIHANSLKNLRAPWRKGESGNPGGRPKSRKLPKRNVANSSSRNGSNWFEDFRAELYEETEHLTAEEVEILNAYEMKEVAKARTRMAANPCIQFANIPLPRVWSTKDSLTRSDKDWLLNRATIGR